MPNKKNIQPNTNSSEVIYSLSVEQTSQLPATLPDAELREESLDEVVAGKGRSFPIIKKIARVVAPIVG